jgi:hypothetical protein
MASHPPAMDAALAVLVLMAASLIVDGDSVQATDTVRAI